MARAVGLYPGSARGAFGLRIDVSPTDPLSLFLAAGLLLVVGCLAASLPARAVARINPLVALQGG